MFAAILVAASGLHVIKMIPIPGDYGWDYLTADTEGRRLYVSHDKQVDMLDLDSGANIGKIPSSDSHGIAVVRDLGRGFISATDPGSVTIFDLKTLAVINKVPVGADPNAIICDRKTRRIFTDDRTSNRSYRHTGTTEIEKLLSAESVDTSMAGFATLRPHPPGGRTAIPAARRYAPAVSRRR